MKTTDEIARELNSYLINQDFSGLYACVQCLLLEARLEEIGMTYAIPHGLNKLNRLYELKAELSRLKEKE